MNLRIIQNPLKGGDRIEKTTKGRSRFSCVGRHRHGHRRTEKN